MSELNTDGSQFAPLGSEDYVESPPVALFSPLGLAIIAGVVLLLAAILVPNFMKARARGQLTACKSNLKNIATALEMYASDNKGRYPASLDRLTTDPQHYLKIIPTCPGAGKNSYQDYRFSTKPDTFSLSCCGNNHGNAYTGFNTDSSNYPRYTAVQGLLDHP
ncbi:type II secretion system protein [bacterium]|nr:type II secretion system protein [bacterium]